MNDETLDRIDRKLDALVKDVDEVANGIKALKYQMYFLLALSLTYAGVLGKLLHG